MNLFQFIRVGDIVFDPQLRVTGDATPWSWATDWLGVKKDELPKLVFSNVTMLLDELGSEYVLSTYKKALRKMT